MDDGLAVFRDVYFGAVPALLRPLVVRVMRAMMYHGLYLNGFARFSDQEKIAIQQRNIDALAGLLGDQKYFGGSDPAIVDCTVYSFLECYVAFPVSMLTIRAYILGKSNLASYIDRMRALTQSATTN